DPQELELRGYAIPHHALGATAGHPAELPSFFLARAAAFAVVEPAVGNLAEGAAGGHIEQGAIDVDAETSTPCRQPSEFGFEGSIGGGGGGEAALRADVKNVGAGKHLLGVDESIIGVGFEAPDPAAGLLIPSGGQAENHSRVVVRYRTA